MRTIPAAAALLLCSCAGGSCTSGFPPNLPFESGSQSTERCQFVDEGSRPQGEVDIRVETVVDGLETPWALAFLPDGEMLITERPGRLRRVEDGELAPGPLVEIDTADTAEGGLLGLALHPSFAENRLLYVYVTRAGPENRVERWRLDEGASEAVLDEVIVSGIPAARLHNGGRLRFGPDGMLYVATGDAREPELAQNRDSLAGKILRVTPDGDVPADNPFEGSLVYVLGLRNPAAFDFLDDGRLAIVDHGPSGELLRTGGDEVNVASAGDNLGWPDIWQCEEEAGLVTPLLAFDEAVPPGGGAFYTGEAIPQWRGAFLFATLATRHLHLVRFSDDATEVEEHELYLQNEFGRLRDVVMGPDGELYVSTSRCDGRGTCPQQGDSVLRVTR